MAPMHRALLTVGCCTLALLAGSGSVAAEPLDCFVAPALTNIDGAPGSATENSKHNFVCHTAADEHVLLTNQPQAESLRKWDEVEVEAELPPALERQALNQSAFSPESIRINRVTPRVKPYAEDLALTEPASDDTNGTVSELLLEEHERTRERRLQSFISIKDVRLMHAVRLEYNGGNAPSCSVNAIESGFQGNSGRNVQNFFLEKSNFKIDLRRKTGPISRPLGYAFTVRMGKNMPRDCSNLRAEIARAGQLAWSQQKIRTDQVSHVEYFLPANFPSCEGFKATGNYACNEWDGNRITERRGKCYTVLKDCSLHARISALSRNLGLLRATAYTYAASSELDPTSVMGAFMSRRGAGVGNMRIWSAPEMYRTGWGRSKVETILAGSKSVTLAPLNFPEDFVRQYKTAIRVPATGSTSGIAVDGYYFISLRGAYDDSWFENLDRSFSNTVVIQHAGARGTDLVATLKNPGHYHVTQSGFAIVRCSGQQTYVQVGVAKFSGDNWQSGVNTAKSRCQGAIRNAVASAPWSCAAAQARNIIGKRRWPQRGEEWCESPRRNTKDKCERYTAVDFWASRPIVYQASPCMWKGNKCQWMDSLKLTCPMNTRASNCSSTDRLRDLRGNGLTFEYRDSGSWCGSQKNRGSCENSMAVTQRAYSNGGRGRFWFEERQRCRWQRNQCELASGRGNIAWCLA